MGTKNNPGKWDCYSAAHPDEPMFVLLGRDPSACVLVALWADIREAMGEDPAKVQEARECASALARWAIAQGKQEKILKAADLAFPEDDRERSMAFADVLEKILPIDWSEPQVVPVIVKPPSTSGMAT